jgi:hypothetical protein
MKLNGGKYTPIKKNNMLPEDIKKEEEIALHDIKQSIGDLEFKALLEISKAAYKSLSKQITRRKDSLIKNEEAFKMTIEMMNGGNKAPSENFIKGVKNVSEAITRQSDRDFSKYFTSEIKSIKHVTDFLNRFQLPGKEYEYLDLKFTEIHYGKKEKK